MSFFVNKKKQALLVQYVIMLQVKMTFLSLYLGCFVSNNFNVHAINSVDIFLTKSTSLLEQNIYLKNEPSKFDVASKKKTDLMWPEHDYFRNVACSIQLEKGNMPQNNLFYLNQGLLLYKGCKKLFYDDYFILSQVLERSNPPSDIKNHIFDECEVLLYRAK